jgi:class 3 adenylate cyclase
MPPSSQGEEIGSTRPYASAVEQPDTSYVRRPDGVSIAYQVVGDGPLDVVVVPGFISHLDLQWTDPGFARFMERLTSFARVILFDKPGTGVSDPIPHVPTLDERIHDIALVLDAAGSERAALFGSSEGGPACILFAATWPQRVTHLVLYGSFGKGRLTREDLEGEDLEMLGIDDPDAFLAEVEASLEMARALGDKWGQGESAEIFAPSAASGRLRRFFAIFERASASPARLSALVDAIAETDVSGVIPALTAPTLVLHRTDDFVNVAGGRYLASKIPGALFAELPGQDHAFWVGDSEPLLAEVEHFVTGARGASRPNRFLATVLFTDIVDSTRRAGEMGDAAWRALLERHHAVVRRQLETFDGREIDTAGDGFLAVFEGPAQAIRCARAAIDALDRELGLPIRAGVHTGEAESAPDGRVAGMAVHIGARVSSLAGPGEVLVSNTVKDLVLGSELQFADRGTHVLKGVPGEWRVFAVTEERRASTVMQALPPASSGMTTGDRVVVGLARHAPRAMRFAAGIAQRGS